MKKTKGLIKLGLLALLLVSVTTVFAQKDAKAKELLDKSSNKYSQSGGISANFTMNVKDVKAKSIQSFDGSILMKDDKFYLSTPDIDTWFNGKTQWTYSKGNEEVNISTPTDRDVQMMNPAFIFTMYKMGSGYKYIGEKTDAKKRAVSEVELTPQNKNGDIKKIILQINKSDYMPVMFHIVYKNSMENIVIITKYQTNMTYSDNTFVFDKTKYPKVEIIDLR